MAKTVSSTDTPLWLPALASALAFALVFKLVAKAGDGFLLWVAIVALPFAIWLRMRKLKRIVTAELKGDLAHFRTRAPLTLYGWITRNLLGHHEAVREFLRLLDLNVLLSQRGRHLGAFLLMGPTGTGKTFFAHLLAEGLFGPDRVLVVPMGQFSSAQANADALFKLILDQYRKTPEFVLVLDEIDRAAPHVRNAFFHLLDHGEVVDPATSERYLLQYVAVVATTNLGANRERNGGEVALAGGNLRDSLVSDGLEKALVARFDGVFLFDQLSRMDTVAVALLQLRAYYSQFEISVEYVEPEALLGIVRTNSAYKEYGVRQLQRLVRSMSDPVVMSAKQRGLSSLVLGFEAGASAVRIREPGQKGRAA